MVTKNIQEHPSRNLKTVVFGRVKNVSKFWQGGSQMMTFDDKGKGGKNKIMLFDDEGVGGSGVAGLTFYCRRSYSS